MEIEQEYQQGQSYAWADYYNVITRIQVYYYELIEKYRKYFFLHIKGKDSPDLLLEIQSYIITLYDLLRHYKSINDKKMNEKIGYTNPKTGEKVTISLNVIFNTIKKSERNLERMNFQTITLCKDAIVRIHFLLGLSAIEKDKLNPSKAISGG